MNRSLILPAALALALTAAAASAQPAPAPGPAMDDNTLLFCKDGPGQMRVMKFATLGTVVKRYATRFNFGLQVAPGKPMTLVFSDPADSPYSITYQAEAYNDGEGHQGLALLSMHLFLDNADRTIEGPPMCYFTEFGR